MSARMYLVITVEDRDEILAALRESTAGVSPRLLDMLTRSTGAPMDEIAADLQGLGICTACSIEGMAAHCESIHAQQIGRRVRRLLEIARGERKPWEHDA